MSVTASLSSVSPSSDSLNPKGVLETCSCTFCAARTRSAGPAQCQLVGSVLAGRWMVDKISAPHANPSVTLLSLPGACALESRAFPLALMWKERLPFPWESSRHPLACLPPSSPLWSPCHVENSAAGAEGDPRRDPCESTPGSLGRTGDERCE